MYFLVSNATRHRYLHGSVVFRQTCTQMQSVYINKRVFFDSITSSFQSWEAKSTIFPAHSAGHGATECLWPNSAPLRLCKDPLFHGQELGKEPRSSSCRYCPVGLCQNFEAHPRRDLPMFDLSKWEWCVGFWPQKCALLWGKHNLPGACWSLPSARRH